MTKKTKKKEQVSGLKKLHGRSPKLTSNKQFQLEKYLSVITLVVVCALIFLPPYFQGLFFKKQIFATHFFTSIALILVIALLWVKKERVFIKTPLDWAVLAFAAAYLISLIGAVHPGDAWYGFLKVLNYFAIYLAVSNVIRDFDDIETFARVLVASGVGVAAIGILAALGYSNYPGAFKNEALYSTLQYSNSTAVFLGVMALVAIGLWTREKRIDLKIVYLFASSFTTLAVIATISKGAWLIYGVGAVLLVIGMPGVYRLKAIYGLIASSVAAAATFSKFYPAITTESTLAAVYLLIGAVVVLAAIILWEVLEYLYRIKGGKTVVIATILISILALTSMFSLGQEFLQEQNITREVSELFDPENSSYTSRMDFNRWGWEIVKDFPINGTGAGGWSALYHQYQDYLIWTTEVHNHFLQVWIETGLIGFISWMAIIIVLIRSVFYYRKKSDRHNWMLVWSLTSAALALLAHSLIDFDFSIPAVFIVYWSLLALINRASYMEIQNDLPNLGIVLGNYTMTVLLTGVLLVSGLSYSLAILHAEKADYILAQMNQALPEQRMQLFQDASRHYLKAIQLDGYNAEYRAEWANLKAIQYNSFVEAGNPQASIIKSQLLEAIQDAERLSPYDLTLRNRLLEVSMAVGDINLMTNQAKKAVVAEPMVIDTYILLASVLNKGINYYEQNGDTAQMREYAQELVDLENNLLKKTGSINKERPWLGKPLVLPPEVQANVSDAKKLLE